MPLPGPDALIQALAAELAALHAEDRAAILATLSEHERQIVEQFLRMHVKGFEAAVAASNMATTYDPSRVSAWLSERLQAAAQENGGMTPSARQALLDRVAKLHPVSP